MITSSGRTARNRYMFEVGNPLRYTDPSGHWYYDPGCDCVVEGTPNDAALRQQIRDTPTPTTDVVANPLSVVDSMEVYKNVWEHQEVNACGPTSAAFVMNMVLLRQGERPAYDPKALAQSMKQSGYSLPDIFEDNAGATDPIDLALRMNRENQARINAGEPSMGTITYMNGGTKQDLLDNVFADSYAIILTGNVAGGAHYRTVVGYDPATDSFLLLDPDESFHVIGSWVTWDDIYAGWIERGYWPWRGAMISVVPNDQRPVD